MNPSEDLVLSVRRVGIKSQFPDGSYDLAIETSQGTITGILHPSEGGTGAVIWVSGALGGFNGPAGGLYPWLARDLLRYGISSLRITYRWPNELGDCVLDTLAAASVLKGLGAQDLVIVGHSFGGAVAILAGSLSLLTRAVIALSSQLFGTHTVDQLSPRALYLLHGAADERLPARSSVEIFTRAREPKQLVIVPGAGHSLIEAADRVREQVQAWLWEALGRPAPSGAAPTVNPTPDVFDVFGPATDEPLTAEAGKPERPEVGAATAEEPGTGQVRRLMQLTDRDLLQVAADAIVCPANDQLLPDGTVGQHLIAAAGASLADQVRRQRRPCPVGTVIPLEGGSLPFRYVLQAVIARADNPFQAVSEATIAQATATALGAAAERGLRAIALPSLGTGGAGLAFEHSARAMTGAIYRHLRAATPIERVILALPSDGARRIYAEAAASLARSE